MTFEVCTLPNWAKTAAGQGSFEESSAMKTTQGQNSSRSSLGTAAKSGGTAANSGGTAANSGGPSVPGAPDWFNRARAGAYQRQAYRPRPAPLPPRLPPPLPAAALAR